MNVDGCIGALFLDLLASSGAFTKKEADEVVQVRFAFLVTTPDTQHGLGSQFAKVKSPIHLSRHPFSLDL